MTNPTSKISHVDLVVGSIERSLPFYRALLEPIGWSGYREVRGERGETIRCLSLESPGVERAPRRRPYGQEAKDWLKVTLRLCGPP